MVFEHVHPLVLLVWSLAISTTAIFGWLTVSNLVSLRRFDDAALRLYAAFTAAGAVDAAMVAITFLPLESGSKARIFQLLWVTGTVSVGLWVRAVARFIGAKDHRVVRWLWGLMCVIAVVVLADFAMSLVSGESLMYEYGPRGSRSILVAASGDVFRHRPLADIISTVAILGILVSALSLLVIARKVVPEERWVQVGVLLTAVFGATQAGLAGGDSPYTAPLLFMANLVEAMRITWVSRARIGEELEVVRRKQEEQSILIDHQLEQLQLADRMATIGEHTAQVTHDLRNPLGAVLAGVELAELELAEPEPDHAQIAESLGLARASVEHTLTLVRRITSQAKTSDLASPQPLDLRAIVNDALSLCRQRTQGVQLELEIPGQLAVLGRSTELIQLFVNLVSNACDAMAGLDTRRIRIRAHAGSAMVELELEDAGLRPPDAIITRMFKERFTTHADAEGTGLGLSICARIVRQHQGTIAVDPQARHTTIRIALPVASRA